MEKSKLLQLLNTFSAWDLRRLEKFLHSPYHNRRDDVIRLFEFYRDAQGKQEPNFSAVNAHKAVWPGLPPTTVDYPNVRSYLYKLIEKYLAAERIFSDDILLKTQLAKAYAGRSQKRHFDQTMRDTRSMLDKQPKRNPEYLRRRFDLEYEKYEHVASPSRTEATNLVEVGVLLDAFYFAEKLKLACLQLFDQGFKKEEAVILPELLTFLQEKPDWLSYPAIAIYYYTYLALTAADNEFHFREVRRLLLDYSEQFTKREIRDIFLFCSNYCIKRSNQGELLYTRECFELYRSGIEQGYLLTDGYLSHHSYINTVALGCTLQEYGWVSLFIDDYKPKIAPNHRDHAVLFCKARLQRDLGNYPEAMRLLAQYETADPYYFMIAKVSLARIFYELDEFDPLESLLESMGAYLKRHKLEEKKKEHFEKQVKLMKLLANLAPHDQQARIKLHTEVNALPMKVDKEWFLKQLE